MGGHHPTQGAVVCLEELDISAVRGGGHGDHKVVHVGENYPSMDDGVEWGDVDDREQPGDGAALGGPDGDWGEGFG